MSMVREFRNIPYTLVVAIMAISMAVVTMAVSMETTVIGVCWRVVHSLVTNTVAQAMAISK
jgi:hypothetical protein